MSAPVLDFPVFDADNHFYETEDSLTKFLPERYKNAIHYVEVKGRHEDRGAGRHQRVHPQPDLRGRGPAGRAGGLLRHGNPEGKSYRELMGEPMKAIPAFREPAARLELLDELRTSTAR